MLCYRCKKRPAVVFISGDKNSSNAQGLCMTCAKELGIKPISDIMERMGVSEDELNAMQEQISEFMSGSTDETENTEEDSEDGFTAGGATTFPFIKGIFSNIPFMQKSEDGKETGKKDEKDEKGKKKPKRKHLDMYCYNLTKRAREGKLDRIIGRENEIA